MQVKHVFKLSLAIFLGLLSAAPAVNGQALSISKTGTNYWINASASAEAPYTLQASENLHLWVDIKADIQEPYSFQFEKDGVKQRYYRFVPAQPPADPIRVMMIGDSMVADCCGWGGGIYPYFKENATVLNYAQPWMSSKVFLQSPEWDKMLLIKPNYLFVYFAWSDSAVFPPDRASTPSEFVENLGAIIDAVRSFDGVPILFTLHAGRYWDESGKLKPSDIPYNALIKQVGAEKGAQVIDTYKITWDLLNQLGREGSAFFQWASGDADDVMHMSPLGGTYVSRLIAQQLPDNLGPYLTDIFVAPPKP